MNIFILIVQTHYIKRTVGSKLLIWNLNFFKFDQDKTFY